MSDGTRRIRTTTRIELSDDRGVFMISVAAELARRSRLPAERLVLGGRSMGGRYCSQVVGDEELPVPALGLLLLGYPLHPAGQPTRLRVEHFPRLRVPCLFLSGTRDALAGRDALTKATKAVAGSVTLHWLESADHGYRPLKASGRTADDVMDEVAAASNLGELVLEDRGRGRGVPKTSADLRAPAMGRREIGYDACVVLERCKPPEGLA